MEPEPASSDSVPEGQLTQNTPKNASEPRNATKLTLIIKPKKIKSKHSSKKKKSKDSSMSVITGDIADTTTSADTATLTVDTNVPATAGHAVWTDADLDCLLEFLLQNKSRAGDGGSFTSTVFNEAATECNKIRTQGAIKTGKMVKNKWSSVCLQFRTSCQSLTHFP